MWYVQTRSPPGYREIQRKNPLRKCRQHMFLKPGAKNRSLGFIAMLNKHYSQLKLQKTNYQREHRACRDAFCPLVDIPVDSPAFAFAQLGDDIRIEQIDPQNLIRRCISSMIRGGMNSTSAASGIASASAMLSVFEAVIR